MNSTLSTWQLLGLFVVILGQVLFLLATFLLSRARVFRVRELRENEFFCSELACKLLEHRDRYLFTAQLGVVLLSALSGAALARFVLLAEPFWATPHAIADTVSNSLHIPSTVGSLATFLALCFLAAAIVVGFVFTIRTVFLQDIEKTVCYLALPLLVLLCPFAWTVALLELALGKLLANTERASEDAPDETPASIDELSELVDHSEEAGELDEEERDMIQGVFVFSETVVREIMTPRPEVIALQIGATLLELKETFRESGRSRLLVYGDNLDDIRGVLLFKDLIKILGEPPEGFEASKLMREPFIVREDALVSDVFKELKLSGTHFAVVLDEHGGLAGVITIEDLVEQIVGEISDEFDREDLPALAADEHRDGELQIDGSALIADLNDEYEFELPDGEYDTIAGYVIYSLGRIPAVGDMVSADGLTITVSEMDQHRVAEVRIRREQLAGEQAH